jgi:hypothetical protein
MKTNRRGFLKTAGLAVSAGIVAPAPALAAARTTPPPGASDMPTAMTFVTIRRGGEQSLGIRTDRGIIDVKKAEASLKLKAPTTIDEVMERGGGPALRRLVERASNGKSNGFMVSEDSVEKLGELSFTLA